MADQHRITFELQSSGAGGTVGSGAGWSESWYDPAAVSDDLALQKALALAVQRRRLLTTGWALNAARVSRWSPLGLQRLGRLEFIPLADARGTYGTSGPPNDEQPYDALVVRVETVAARRRMFLMRGIPTDTVTAGNVYTPNGAWIANFKSFEKALTGTGLGILNGSPYAVRIRTVGPELLVTAVNLVEPPIGASGRRPIVSVIPTAVGDLPIVGQQVIMKGVTPYPAINGLWLVGAISAPVAGAYSITLRPKRGKTVTGISGLGGGSMQKITYSLDNITRIQGEYGASRRTGRPLQLTRGRRSNRG